MEEAPPSNDELVNWSGIIKDNEDDPEDPIKSLLGRQATTSGPIKRAKGRPKKVSGTVSPGLPEQQPIGISSEAPSELEQIPSAQLANMFLKNHPPEETSVLQKKTKTGSLRFSSDKHDDVQPESTEPDPERVTLLKMYKQYFRKPLLDRHKRRERVWLDSHLNSEIHREIQTLENEVSEDDPVAVLAGLWVGSMGVVESFGPAFNLRTENLTLVSHGASQDPKFRDNMRELLIKYPYLRMMIGLGGYPELKLLITTVTLIKELDKHNKDIDPTGTNQTALDPEDLNKAYQNL